MPMPILRAGDGAGGAGAARHRAKLVLPMSVKVEDEGNHGCPRPGRSSVRNIRDTESKCDFCASWSWTVHYLIPWSDGDGNGRVDEDECLDAARECTRGDPRSRD